MFLVMIFMFSNAGAIAQEFDETKEVDNNFKKTSMKRNARQKKMGDKKNMPAKRGFRIPEDVKKSIKGLSDEKKKELTKARELISTYRELAMMSRKEKNTADAVKWIGEIKSVKVPADLPENISKFLNDSKKMLDIFIFETYLEANDISSAEKYLNKALENGMEPMQAAMVCRRAAKKFKKLKNNEKAREYLLKAVEYFNK